MEAQFYCTARQCSPIIINPALSLLMKHPVTGQRQKGHNFSAFHWSPHGNLVSIGQHLVTTRLVHLPKRTETSLITESDQSGPNHQLLQLCTARTAWSDSNQAVRAVHTCNSWFLLQSASFAGGRLKLYLRATVVKGQRMTLKASSTHLVDSIY